jgi:hypothetical protein
MGRRDGPLFFYITASSSISHPLTVGDLRKAFDPLCLYEASAIKASDHHHQGKESSNRAIIFRFR